MEKGVFYPPKQRKIEEERLARFHKAVDAGYPCVKMRRNEQNGELELVIWKSKRLKDTGFEKVTAHTALKDICGQWDEDKLRQAIALLDNWLDNGLPEPEETHVKKYTVVEHIASYFTQKQNNKVQEASIDERAEVELKEAWEVADRFYLKAFEYYTTLENEVKKYDTVRAKKEELEGILVNIC